jgi:hypothetical protein
MATETLRLLLPRMSEGRGSAMIQAIGAVAGTDRPAQAGQRHRLPGAGRRPGLEEHGRCDAGCLGDAAGPAVLLPVGEAGFRIDDSMNVELVGAASELMASAAAGTDG